MTEEKGGGGGGGLGHFSPSGGRVRDDVACPVRCPVTRIITGTCTAMAQTPNPGIKCGKLNIYITKYCMKYKK